MTITAHAEMNAKLRRALQDLLEQVRSLNGYELTRDIEPHKAQACWDYAVEQAGNILGVTG